MPSSEDIMEAEHMVRQWYAKRLKDSHPDWPKSALDAVLNHTSYQEMRDTYVQETGAYTGPYSAL